VRLLLDTHIWLWYVLGSKDLPHSLHEALDEAIGRCWLSPISLWEANLLNRKGRLRVHGSFDDWAEEALEAVPMREAGFSFEVAKTVANVTLPHGDPADHFIAATALVYDLTLVTVDGKLVDAQWLSTLTR